MGIFRDKREKLLNLLMILIGIHALLTLKVKGQQFERKQHGVRSELASFVMDNITTASKIECGAECTRQSCKLMHYTNTTHRCVIYSVYMSDDQLPVYGLFAVTGAADQKPCPPLSAPRNGYFAVYGNFYGNMTEYACLDLYIMVAGDRYRVCADNATWTGEAPVCEANRTTTAYVGVLNGGPMGDWGRIQFCDHGSFVAGYNLRIQPSGGDDDTGLNTIELICKSLDWTRTTNTITSSAEDIGTWTGSEVCQMEHFVIGFVMQVDSGEGSGMDYSGVNYVKLKCRDFNGTIDSYELTTAQGTGPTGDFGSWSNECDPRHAICGLRTLMPQYLGEGYDDSTLNDIDMYCCAN